MADTAIEWTDVTWNPTTGCDRVSPGCDNCYALTLAKRLKGMGSAKYQTDGSPRTSGPGFGLALHHDTLRLPLAWRKPRKVFVNSMSDLFHDDVPDRFIARVWAVMHQTPQHTYQILTKRHARMRSLLNAPRFTELVQESIDDMLDDPDDQLVREPWPPGNVWVGVSVENQRWADIRVPALLDTPAAVRFLSCEPLLGPIDLGIDDPHRDHQSDDVNGHPHPRICLDCSTDDENEVEYFRREPGGGGIDWVITGGESGPGFRYADPDWFRSIRDQCAAAGVAYLHKQNGGQRPKSNGRELDGVTHDGYPEASHAVA